jgi:hypothetical protein
MNKATSDIGFEKSGIQVVALDASTVTDTCWAFERGRPSRTVRFVRGSKMLDSAGVFDQFGAALQFPYYFGENWAAFSECIQDLTWLPATHYVIVIFDAEQLLKTHDEDFAVMMGIFRDCCRNWAKGLDLGHPWARGPAKFQVLLQTSLEHLESLRFRLGAPEAG